MSETPKQLRVFLCHSSHDKRVVRDIYQKLSAIQWIDPWLDEKKLLPGHDWNMEIEKAVEAAHIVLVFLTNSSINKEGYIQRELRQVLEVALNMAEGTIFVIPLRLDDCELPRRLRSWQWLDYFPAEARDEAYERLLVSLRVRAEKLGIGSASVKTPKKAKHSPKPTRKLAADVVAPPPVVEPDSDLDLHIPSEYSGAIFTPPLAKVKTWTFGGIEFVKVPHGEFLMGSNANNKLAFDDEKPQHKFNIPYDFLMARFQVTNEHFEKFVITSSYSTLAEQEGFGWIWNGKEWQKTEGANWKHPRGPQSTIDGLSRHPVVQVTWADGLAYFDWLNKEFGKNVPSGLVFRAPTEADWEKAARGGDGREYPWGNEFNSASCNSSESGRGGTTPVGAFSPQGDSPYGICDLTGNVWEWTVSLWGKKANAPDFKYPYNPRDGREMLRSDDDVLRVVRGGSFGLVWQFVRATARGRSLPYVGSDGFGLRVVLAPRLL